MFRRRNVSTLVLSVVSFALPASAQTTWYVDDDASLGGDGTSWNSPYKFLQDAQTAAADRDEIHLAGGIYRPDLDEGGNVTPGDREATFQLVSGVTLYGGYAGLGNPGNPDERDIETFESILSGDLAGNDAPDFVNNDENSYHVVTGCAADGAATLDGVTIEAGNADGDTTLQEIGGGIYDFDGTTTLVNCTVRSNAAVYGGGIYVRGGDPGILGCVFEGNKARWFGGAAYVYTASPTFSDCRFVRNQGEGPSGGYAAGVYLGTASPTLSNCEFIENSAYNQGGGLYHEGGGSPTLIDCTFRDNVASSAAGMITAHGEPTLINCAFIGNSSESYSGGMHSYEASPTLIDCLFSGNRADTHDGGAFYAVNNPARQPTLIHCTFNENAAGQEGGGLYVGRTIPGEPLPAVITNCIFWGNTDGGGLDESSQIHAIAAVINYSCIQGWTGGWGGTGNHGNDPVFVDADGPDDVSGTEDDNLRLAAGSPCVDAGDNAAVPADAFDLDGDGNTTEPTPIDLDGNPRFLDDPSTSNSGNGTCPIVDMGPYEFVGLPECIPTVSEWGMVVMILLVLTGGTLVLRRPQAARPELSPA